MVCSGGDFKMKSHWCISVCYFCVAVFSFCLLAIILLDQESSSENCLISRYNASSNDLLDYLGDMFCEGLIYTCSVLIALPIFIIAVIWFGRCCASKTGWWILQLLLDFAAFIVAILVALVFTMALTVFCGDVYDRTGNSCVNGVRILDQGRSKRQIAINALEFLSAAVAISWIIVLFWLLDVLLVMVHLATSYYQMRLEALETKAEDMEFSLQQQTLELNQRRSSYNFDPPQLPTVVHNPRHSAGADNEPLIQL